MISIRSECSSYIVLYFVLKGHFVIAYGTNDKFKTLSKIPDDGKPSLTLYVQNINLPERYVYNH